MNNNWENEPSLDYFELRRRHEEYKNSQRKAKEQPDAWEDAPEDAASQDEGYYNAEDQRAAAPQDIPEEADLDADAESYPADDNDAEDAPVDDNPNPFDSFISAFHGLRSRFGKRRKGDVADDEEYEDGDDSDAGARPRAEQSAPDAGEAADVEDLPEDARPAGRGDEDALEYPDDVYDDDDGYDADAQAPSGEPGGFKKFLRLFVVPVNEDERKPGPDADNGGDEDDDDWQDGGDGDWDGESQPVDAGAPEDDRQSPTAEAEDIEGGLDMSDQNKVTAELASQLAAEMENPGLSRRERREQAMRQAAEKAAAGAEQAGTLFEEKPLEADSVTDVASGIVDVAPVKGDIDVSVDEPTREFKPVSKANFDPFLEQEKSESAAEADDGEDEEEEEEKPARRGLFGRRRKEEPEEDGEDEEDDEEEDEKPRRGLFGRRAARRDEEDEEEEEDDYEDDEDDEDEEPRRGRRHRYEEDEEYDEYDEDDEDYDDEEDDEYDDDEEGESASFGHVLLGILKGFLTAVMLLLFVVVVLNVLNIFNVVKLDNLASRLPTRMADMFLPSQNMKQKMNVEAQVNPVPAVQQLPAEEAQPQPEAEPAAPVEEAPVEEPSVEAEPVEEAPQAEVPAAVG